LAPSLANFYFFMKKNLEITLEKLQIFKNPKLKWEQYPTPPALAAELAVTASLIDEGLFFDLGCGTGILSIAFSLIGFEVVGVDIDVEALKIARKNAKSVNAGVDFILCDIRFLKLRKRVNVVMNPPFGIKRRHADRVFLEKAFEIGEVIYSIHSISSQSFVERTAEENGFKVTHVWRYKIPLKKLYHFHEKPYKLIPVEVFRMEKM